METDLQESWAARELGKTAAIDRLPRTVNPYAKHSLLWLAWVEGYIHVCAHRVGPDRIGSDRIKSDRIKSDRTKEA